MKKFLVPLDFSETSAHTLQFVFEFNKHFFAQLDLIHLFDVPFAIADEEGQLLTGYEAYRKNFEDDLWEFVNEHKGEYHYDIKVHASAGGYYQGIMGFAKQAGSELIIVGNRGTGKSKPFRFGSVAKYLITHPEVPVLAVPEDFEAKEFKKIVVATDLSDTIPESHFTYIKNFADRLNSSINAIHVNLKNETELEGEYEFIRKIEKQFGTKPVMINKKANLHVYETIRDYMQENDAQVLVTFPHRHSWLDQLFLGSETANVLRNSNVLVLSMPERV
ncbi:universal stress protein [Pollutibacter soli]|uniref:universal stress protein n=1 Tax=Pollutibacter soli TaxID=3034157 RepID=UPI0030137F47